MRKFQNAKQIISSISVVLSIYLFSMALQLLVEL